MKIKRHIRLLNDRDISVIKQLIQRELRDYPFSKKYKFINDYREILRCALVNVLMPGKE